MKILSKLVPSFEGCAVAGLVLAGIASVVWGCTSITLYTQGISWLLCFSCFGAAIFIHLLAKRVLDDEELEADIASSVKAQWASMAPTASDDEPNAEDGEPEVPVKGFIQEVFTQFADLFAPRTETAHRSA